MLIINKNGFEVDYLLGLIDEPFSFLRDNSTIIIPNNFGKSDIEDIKDYIAYVKYKKENTVR